MQLQSNAIKLLQLKIKQMCSKQPDWSGSVSDEASIIERKVWREFLQQPSCVCVTESFSVRDSQLRGRK